MTIKFVDDILTLDTSVYADGDVLFDTHTVANAVSQPDQAAMIKSIIVADEDNQGEAMDLIFLEDNTSIGTVNAADTLSAADAAKIYGIVTVAAGDFISLANSNIAVKTDVNIPIKGDGNAIHIAGLSRGTGTYSASGVVLKIGVDT